MLLLDLLLLLDGPSMVLELLGKIAVELELDVSDANVELELEVTSASVELELVSLASVELLLDSEVRLTNVLELEAAIAAVDDEEASPTVMPW